MAQYSKRRKHDLISQILRDFEEIKVNSSFEYLRNISSNSFKKLAKLRIKAYFFNDILNKKNSYSKLQRLEYDNLEMQSYLYDANTTIDEKIVCFKWRTSMERTFGENFRGGRDNLVCPHCAPNLSHVDSQEESFTRCAFIKKNAHISENYAQIFEKEIQPNFIRKLSRISELRRSNIQQ